ncbi:hypothetical protein SFIMM107S_05877 [Streptomyces griseus]
MTPTGSCKHRPVGRGGPHSAVRVPGRSHRGDHDHRCPRSRRPAPGAGYGGASRGTGGAVGGVPRGPPALGILAGRARRRNVRTRAPTSSVADSVLEMLSPTSPRPPPVRRPSPRPARSPNEPPTRWPQRSIGPRSGPRTAAPQGQQARQGQQAVRSPPRPPGSAMPWSWQRKTRETRATPWSGSPVRCGRWCRTCRAFSRSFRAARARRRIGHTRCSVTFRAGHRSWRRGRHREAGRRRRGRLRRVRRTRDRPGCPGTVLRPETPETPAVPDGSGTPGSGHVQSPAPTPAQDRAPFGPCGDLARTATADVQGPRGGDLHAVPAPGGPHAALVRGAGLPATAAPIPDRSGEILAFPG